MYKLSKRSRERLEGVHPSLISLIDYALIDSPYDFGIPLYGGLRTVEDQQELYSKGRTKEGKIVTYTDGINKKSNHQAKGDGYGHAFDIFILVGGKATWEHKYYKEVADHIKKCANELEICIEWGGDWTRFKDYPHFQLCSC